MNSVHRAIFFSAVERYGSLFFFLLSTAVLSRLLTPAEFGVYAAINALTAVAAASFQEFGGANYLIQKQSLSEGSVRTASTITFCLSALFAAILFELRDMAAWFFSEEGLKIGIAVSTVNFLLSPFIMTISALLRRDMAFGQLARCNLAGNFVNALTSIALAVLNFGFMSPLLGGIAGNATVLTLLIVSRQNLRIFLPSFSGYREVIHFGAYSGGVALINVFYNLAPQLILGRVLDFTAVGLYSRALNITQVFDRLVLQILSPVTMPAIVAHAREGRDLKRAFLQAAELIAVVQWPFLIFFALMTDSIISIWLGSTWAEIVPLIRMLCVGSVSLFAGCLIYPILVAAGRIRDTLTSSLISLPPCLLVIFGASFYGVQVVAASFLVTMPFQAAVALYFVSRRLAISPADLFNAMLKSGIVTACSTAGVLLSLPITKFSLAGPILGLLLGSIFSTIGWGLGLVMTKHPLLGQMRLAANGIAGVAPRFLFLGPWAPVVRPDRKSP
jgi:O-antigen/teichoic acid export membrane protein